VFLVADVLFFGLQGKLEDGLILGLVDSLFFGTVGGVIGALAGRPSIRPRRIVVTETVRWSWKRALPSGIIVGLGTGLVSTLVTEPIHALRTGFVDGLIVAMLMGLGRRAVVMTVAPNQGIRRSARNAIVVGLVVGLTQGVAIWIENGMLPASGSGLVFILIYVLIGILACGGFACLSHFALRLVLWHRGSLPWKIVPFLDYCAERIFLRKVGGGYIFIHRMLMEHFASLDPQALDIQSSGAQSTDTKRQH
jgi:hypothetical protein